METVVLRARLAKGALFKTQEPPFKRYFTYSDCSDFMFDYFEGLLSFCLPAGFPFF